MFNNNESVKQFQHVEGAYGMRFEPASPTNTVRWNPLDEIRLGNEYETGDAQNLANLLVDPGLETHQQTRTAALLAELILHALYKRKLEGAPADLQTVDRMMAEAMSTGRRHS